jgi:hypothetical protein
VTLNKKNATSLPEYQTPQDYGGAREVADASVPWHLAMAFYRKKYNAARCAGQQVCPRSWTMHVQVLCMSSIVRNDDLVTIRPFPSNTSYNAIYEFIPHGSSSFGSVKNQCVVYVENWNCLGYVLNEMLLMNFVGWCEGFQQSFLLSEKTACICITVESAKLLSVFYCIQIQWNF